MMSQPLDERFFNKPGQAVAVLLSGKFKSLFVGRLPEEITKDKEKYDFREESPENSMIVVSDGDIIKNQLHYSKGYPLPLGYDQYTNQMYGNKDFVMNAVDYLCDSSGLITVRSRELKLRLLDRTKITKDKLSIQFLNIALPVVIVLVFGAFWILLRRRKYMKVK
jgi:gliding-associated putative ABC transporter substrate-binding component GldG